MSANPFDFALHYGPDAWNDGSDAVFTPWTDGQAVGYECAVNGKTSYVYLCPSAGGDSPDVVLFEGKPDYEKPAAYVGFDPPPLRSGWRLLDSSGGDCGTTDDPGQVRQFAAAMISDGLSFSVEKL